MEDEDQQHPCRLTLPQPGWRARSGHEGVSVCRSRRNLSPGGSCREVLVDTRASSDSEREEGGEARSVDAVEKQRLRSSVHVSAKGTGTTEQQRDR